MAEVTLAQIEHLSQQLSHRLSKLEDLTSQAWLEHELTRDSFRALSKAYYLWLGEKGIECKI